MRLLPKKILVTGASGFIGKFLVNKLGNKNVNVVATTRNDIKAKGRNYPNVEFYLCDLLNQKDISKLKIIIKDCDCIVHLASLIPDSHKRPDKKIPLSFIENLQMTLNIVSLVTPKIRSFVYASTLDVYGKPEQEKINEHHPTCPQTYYGASKLSTEKYLKIHLKKLGVPLSILRLSSVYGPNDNLIKVIPNFINNIKNDKSPIIYGTGNDMRDYIYVEDVVDSIIKSIEYSADGIFNIATGKSISIKEVCSSLIKISKKNLKPKYLSQKKELINFYFDITLARNKLKFKPKVDIIQGLKCAYRQTLKSKK